MPHHALPFARAASLLALLAAVARAGPASAQPFGDPDDPRIDAETGRDISHWPHPRPFDHLHMRLELDIPDMNVPQLTGREVEILQLMAEHLTNPEIAERLELRPKTVRNNVSNIFTKLQVADRAQAIIAARDAGLG